MLRAAYTHAFPGVVCTNPHDPVCCTLISPMSPYSIHSGSESGPRSWVLTVTSLRMPFSAIPSGTSWCEEAAALRSLPLEPLSASIQYVRASQRWRPHWVESSVSMCGCQLSTPGEPIATQILLDKSWVRIIRMHRRHRPHASSCFLRTSLSGDLYS
ncbi:hypothetical protein OH76DRAFT_19321 [Lentinus brumalis]|uniref:Uncharacterized protein n=1 Tax=Lentinus brumalis TaxID=2498619 RepID=A0A371DXE0_9APHY|nr:hypothetical protein OH76DRAFT_19321 [Polyporus brumalis]